MWLALSSHMPVGASALWWSLESVPLEGLLCTSGAPLWFTGSRQDSIFYLFNLLPDFLNSDFLPLFYFYFLLCPLPLYPVISPLRCLKLHSLPNWRQFMTFSFSCYPLLKHSSGSKGTPVPSAVHFLPIRQLPSLWEQSFCFYEVCELLYASQLWLHD